MREMDRCSDGVPVSFTFEELRSVILLEINNFQLQGNYGLLFCRFHLKNAPWRLNKAL